MRPRSFERGKIESLTESTDFPIGFNEAALFRTRKGVRCLVSIGGKQVLQ